MAIKQLSIFVENREGTLVTVTDAIAKLNTSLKNSDILPPEESESDRRERENKDAIQEALTL